MRDQAWCVTVTMDEDDTEGDAVERVVVETDMGARWAKEIALDRLAVQIEADERMMPTWLETRLATPEDYTGLEEVVKGVWM